jgi:hypothetical protein
MRVINKFDATVWFLDYLQLKALELSGETGFESSELYNLGLMYSRVENMLLENNCEA